MQTSLYVDISGQISLERALSVIAENIANGQTPGFREEKLKFSEVLAQTGENATSFVDSGKTYISEETGPVTYTGNPLDVALKGSGWLGIASPQGQVSYTRDGRMHLSPEGQLQTVEGYSVLDSGGAPIVLDPNSGSIQISSDGTLFQNKQPVGSLGIFKMDPQAEFKRAANASVIPSRPPEPATDFLQDGVAQGYLEGSNVKPILQITRLIEVQRFFEALSAAQQKKSSTLEQGVQTIGKASG